MVAYQIVLGHARLTVLFDDDEIPVQRVRHELHPQQLARALAAVLRG